MIGKFASSTRGNFAVTAAILAPLLLGVGGLGMDYSRLSSTVSDLQEAADSAALASVQEFMLSNATKEQIASVAESYVLGNATVVAQGAAVGSDIDVVTFADFDKRSVRVEITYRWAPFLAQLIDADVTPVKVSATAALTAGGLTCALGLMQPQKGLLSPKASIHMDNAARLNAEGCAVHSNSVSQFGLRVDGDATMRAGSICSAGGVWARKKSSIVPQAVTDCPKVQDPLANRKAPAVGSCKFNKLEITADTTLDPGVYCGGVVIGGSAKVTLRDGVYVIKDGPLVVKDQASLFGAAVSFHLTGARSVFEFKSDTRIDLAAMSSGPLPGLLFFEDLSVPHSFDFNPLDLEPLLDANIFDQANFPPELRVHRITSRMANNLLGTFYLPRSVLLVDADGSVAQDSAYTALVVGRLWLRKGPVLKLNADYKLTKVPVPGGLLGVNPMLVK